MGKANSQLSKGIAGSLGIRVLFGNNESAPPPVQAVRPPPTPPVTVAEPLPPPVTTPVAPPQPQSVRITLSADALFDFDSAQLRPAGRSSLDTLVQDMSRVQYDVMLISGHTDRLGAAAYNQRLSEHRANAVRDYLIGRGVPANNIRATGYGKSQPVTTPEQCTGPRSPELIACLQPDRRVEVEIDGLRQP
jgi:OOP family OmpA-OmpF porin